MVLNKYLRSAWQSKVSEALWRERMVAWRKEPVTVREEKPLRIDRARAVGYKAKQGFVVVRQRLTRGGRMRPAIEGGRRPKHNRRKKVLSMNYRRIAEQRAGEKFPNMTVLNSYLLCKDGKSSWYEIILVDPQHPNVKNDRALSAMADKRGRVERGLTAAGRQSRGLKNKGTGAEKLRPSLRAHDNTGN